MKKDIISQLHTLRSLEPDESFKTKRKEILMQQISASAQVLKPADFLLRLAQSLMRRGIFAFGRPVAVSLLVIILLAGGGIFSISAASEATPGSFLYTVKLVSEKTRFALALQPEEKIKLNVKFAERRAKEIENLLKDNNGNAIDLAADGLKAEIDSAQKQLQVIEHGNLAGAVEAAKNIDNKTTVLRQKLQDTKNVLSQSSISANSKLDEAIKSIDAANLTALNTIVKSAKNNNKLENNSEISERVASKLKTTKDKITAVRQDVNLVFSAGFSRSEQGLQVYDGAAQAEAKKLAEAKTNEAAKVIAEAEKLLANKDYEEAVNKIAQSENLLNEASATVEKSNENTAEGNSTSTPAQPASLSGEVKGVTEIAPEVTGSSTESK